MAHIVFAAPGIDRFHLHDRLQRELVRRRHRVTTLLADPVAHAFFKQQGFTAELLPRVRSAAGTAPIDELVRREAKPGSLAERRCRRRLLRLEAGLRRWFETQHVDMILLHQRRDADQLLLHFVAREHGCRVLWTGDGLLPHTLQIDERGLDGEAAASHRRVLDYRVVRAEKKLLEACLTHTLANACPFALTPTPVLMPPLGERLATMWPAGIDYGPVAAIGALRAWRRARPEPQVDVRTTSLPASPFVAVLLQERRDVRLQLDGNERIEPHALVAATARSAAAIDPVCRVVVVDPRCRGDGQHATRAANGVAVHRLPRAAATVAAATAICTVTVNHPAASAALLAGTPVVHLGDALYGLPGVTTRCRLADLEVAVAHALAHDYPTLRQRFLTWLFGYGHVWCSPTHPDHNGMLGLVQAIEAHLGPIPHGPTLRYRPGPAWPLAAEGRS